MPWASSLAPYQVSEALFHVKGRFGCVPYNTLFFLVTIMVVIRAVTILQSHDSVCITIFKLNIYLCNISITYVYDTCLIVSEVQYCGGCVYLMVC